MANINIEDYMKDLSPELQEKARACKDKNELMELAAENDIELSEDALEAVAGGCFTEANNYFAYKCTKCGNKLERNGKQANGYDKWALAIFYECSNPNCRQMYYIAYMPNSDVTYGPFMFL